MERALLFVVLTCGLSWAYAYTFFAWMPHPAAPLFAVMGASYMLIPGLVALVLQWREGGVRDGLALRIRPNRWFAVAWVAPVLLPLAVLLVSLALPGVHFSPGMDAVMAGLRSSVPPHKYAEAQALMSRWGLLLLPLAALTAMAAGATINAVFALGEELGWRGYLLRQLAPLGFWPSSLLIGAVWGIWHFPLVLKGLNYPQHPEAGVWLMVVFCTLAAPLFSYVRLRSGSTIAAAILHGTLNGAAGIALLYVRLDSDLQGVRDLLVGLTGVAGGVVLLALNLALAAATRGRVAAAEVAAV